MWDWIVSLCETLVATPAFQWFNHCALLVLAIACAVLYALHLRLREKQKQQQARYEKTVHGLNTELQNLVHERGITRMENQILRDILGQNEFGKALMVLLRWFVPNSNEGFAAFVKVEGQTSRTVQSRGLNDESKASLEIDLDFFPVLQAGKTVVLEGLALQRSRIFSSIDHRDRKKTRQVFISGIGEGRDLFAALVTTVLQPLTASREQQLELTGRLLMAVSGNLRHVMHLEMQSHQLRSTREMLELRAIADGHAEPMKMLERFVTRLSQMISAERGAIYLSSREGEAQKLPLVRCGLQMQRGIEGRWQHHEDSLAISGEAMQPMAILDAVNLKRLGIDSLIGSAITVQLKHGSRQIGLLCLTRRQSAEMDETQIQLVRWASEILAESIQRFLSFTLIERQAKHDGLTDLANRRTFDVALSREVDQIQQGVRSECALLLLDLDRFKSINDNFGHQAGDQVLKQVAKILKEQVSHIRSGDRSFAARYGGEEMAILMPGVGISGAMRVAESVRAAVETADIRFNGQRIPVTVSVGVGSCPLHASSADELLAVADAALYRAKSSGRNRVCASDATMTATERTH